LRYSETPATNIDTAAETNVIGKRRKQSTQGLLDSDLQCHDLPMFLAKWRIPRRPRRNRWMRPVPSGNWHIGIEVGKACWYHHTFGDYFLSLAFDFRVANLGLILTLYVYSAFWARTAFTRRGCIV
jgi:hypothetical protein